MSVDTNIPVKMADGTLIEGSNPIVVIGPNGSGKTRYGAKFAEDHGASFIGALRNIALPDNVAMLGLSQASKKLESQLKSHYHEYWRMANEINHLFSKLLAEDAASAMNYRDACAEGARPKMEITSIMRLQNIWHRLFSGRKINFAGYSPKVRSEYMENEEYPAMNMSDGERVALYLGARVLEAEPGIVVVDEPEIHFHSRLAVRFWNEIEALRPDLRFVYITHDLPFALSRQSPKFIVVKPNEKPQVIEEATLPPDIAESLLGAASFSIYASRVVFCEGDEGKTSDYSLYSAWFSGRDTAVIPVGSCRDVLSCTQSFRNAGLVNGVEAIGIIDSDYWPDEFLSKLPEGVFALPVHEIENLYCLGEVFLGVAAVRGLNEVDAKAKYEEFLQGVRSYFRNGILAKQISERFRKRCEGVMERHLNGLKVNPDIDEMKRGYIASMEPKAWELDPAAIFEEEATRVSNALNGSIDDLMKYLPGKSMIGFAADLLGMKEEGYRGLVDSTLQSPEDSVLKKSLIQVFDGKLPSRQQPLSTSEE